MLSTGGPPLLEAYLKAVSRDRQLRSWKAPAGPDQAVPARRRNLEAQMALLLGEPARSAAKGFAAALPLQAEWEGMSEGPLDEAEAARQWLERAPDTVIRPFLHLFMAHRFRAAYETSRREYGGSSLAMAVYLEGRGMESRRRCTCGAGPE